jgi:hypothetical protein
VTGQGFGESQINPLIQLINPKNLLSFGHLKAT